jgi:hypothetical protein
VVALAKNKEIDENVGILVKKDLPNESDMKEDKAEIEEGTSMCQ